jgi:hypothetical protein
MCGYFQRQFNRSRMKSARHFQTTLLWLAILLPCATAFAASSPSFGPVLFQDDFRSGLEHWSIELERGGRVRASNGVLDIDVPAGATLWLRHELEGPVAIVYEAIAVAAGGANDRVSDLNCFWMARNRDDDAPVYEKSRSGRFADYNTLRTYYVGLGGNGNTTTRFRRYIGDPDARPLLPEHDLSTPETLLVANRKQTIMLIADGSNIEYWRDGRRLMHLRDTNPYTQGWFALRTTQSHLKIEKLRIYRVKP